MDNIIVGTEIVKSYGVGAEKRNILDGVSFAIAAGEFVAVMGPSGSGKSTLMFSLSGLDVPDGGTVLFDGRHLAALPENELADLRRTKMGFVFQQPTLLKNLNLLDNILLPALRDNRQAAAQITARARALMQRTGIAGLEERRVTQASGGQLQRVGICRALMSDPRIIFGDEPTGALNSQASIEIMDLLAQIHRSGTTILLVTHDIKVAARSERVLFMLDGRIAGELKLDGPAASDDDLNKREAVLSAWLAEMHF